MRQQLQIRGDLQVNSAIRLEPLGIQKVCIHQAGVEHPDVEGKGKADRLTGGGLERERLRGNSGQVILGKKSVVRLQFPQQPPCQGGVSFGIGLIPAVRQPAMVPCHAISEQLSDLRILPEKCLRTGC